MAVECPFTTSWLLAKAKVIKYRWEIDNFTNRIHEEVSKLAGPTVHAQGSDLCWKLEILEIETDAGKERYLLLAATPSKPLLNFRDLKVCIFDANNRKVHGVGLVEKVLKTFQKVLLTKLTRLDEVLDNPQLYIPDDKLTLHCTIRYIETEPCKYAAYQLKTPLPVVPVPKTACFMQKVLTAAQFSDIVVVAEEREFPAHRAILAGRSEVFQAMFTVDMEENHMKRVVIEDMSADAVSDLLTFIYSDSAPNIDIHAEELLMAAEKYNIDCLKAVCEEELAASLDINNALDRLVMSDTYRANQLRVAALHWIAKHAADVVETDAWETVCDQHPQLVKVICEQLACYAKELKKSM